MDVERCLKCFQALKAASFGPVVPQADFGLSGNLDDDDEEPMDPGQLPGEPGSVAPKPDKKYSEPANACMPDKMWRLYVFKDSEKLKTWHLHRKSCYIFGRDKRHVDQTIDHPSCSKLHAVVQFRNKVSVNPHTGETVLTPRPYILDLGSSNGTQINKDRIEPLHYYELLEKDVVNFGFSSRDYVLLHANTLKDQGGSDESDSENSSSN